MNIEKKTMLTGWKEPEGLEEKLKADIKLIPELGQNGFEHKKEQFYLMHADGRSDQFLDYFRKTDVSASTATMDLVRIAAKLCGEKFAKETLLYRTFTLEEAISKISDELTMRKYNMLPAIQTKLDAVSKLQEEMTQLKELIVKDNGQSKTADMSKKARKVLKLEYEKKMLELEGKLQEKDAELKAKCAELASADAVHSTKMESVKEKYEAKMDSVRKECEAKIRFMKISFERELEKEQQKLEKLKQEQSMDQGGFFRRRNKRPEEVQKTVKVPGENLEQFLAKILTESRYREDQLDEITAAIGQGLTLEEIRCLCNPGISASGMKRLREFFKKRRDGEDYGV